MVRVGFATPTHPDLAPAQPRDMDMQITFDELDMRLPGGNWVPSLATVHCTVELADQNDIGSWHITDALVEGDPLNEHIRAYQVQDNSYLAKHSVYDPTWLKMIEMAIMRDRDQLSYLAEQLAHTEPPEREYEKELLH